MLTLLREAFFFSRSHLQPLLQIALIYTLPSLLLELSTLGEDRGLPQNAQLLVSGLFMCLGVIQFGAAMLFIDARIKATPISVGNAISAAITQLFPLLLVNLLMGMAIFGGLMLLVLPGLFLAYKFLFAEFLLLFHQRSPLQALRESYRTTQGLAAEVVPPLAIWVGAVILLAIARIALLDGDNPDVVGLVVQELLSMLLSVFGWALLYRLYQRYIADQIVTPQPHKQDEQAPEE
ncbi:MAG TPA: YciC family protein [Motiliproteus sp.]